MIDRLPDQPPVHELQVKCYILHLLLHEVDNIIVCKVCCVNVHIKGEVSRKFAVISKPKYVCLSGRNKEIIVKYVINYPSVQ